MNPLGNVDSRARASLELALIGNCTVSALVDRCANIVWCCMPRFDSPPIFDALLRDQPSRPLTGAMTIELEGLHRVEQAYLGGTAVLCTRLLDANGQGVEVIDFAPRFVTRGRIFRPAQLVRRLRPIGSAPRIRVSIRPRGEQGEALSELGRGSHHIRYAMRGGGLRLNTELPLAYLNQGTWFLLRGALNLLLGPDETLSGGIAEAAAEFEELTTLHWRAWTRRLAVPLEWQDAVIRAAVTLKLCQYEETGAIVAAMTTSIPEAPGSGRNWDYRFCWLRDAFFVVRALNSLAEVGTMENYLGWLYDVLSGAQGDHIQPMYGIGLERDLPESQVAHLSGYRGMGPVRFGNQAYQHHQHDVYGSIVLAAAQSFHDRRLFRLGSANDFALLERMGERAWALYLQPDAGIWELRTRARVHTSSALMCWAACDRLARIAAVLGLPVRTSLWSNRAQIIREAILKRAWNERRQAFVESLDGEGLDASVLLMAEVGFLPATDPRFVSTLALMDQVLCDGPFMRRYEDADDFGRPTTSFNVCSFWRIDALARSGRRQEAREAFERLLACRNAVGLLSEDLDPASGELWGNFPQTYSMVGIIHGAVRLSAPWEDAV